MDTTTKERPIIFRGDGVLGILEDRKTMTRRVIKPQPEFVWGFGVRNGEDKFSAHVRYPGGHQPDPWINCPYGKPGDRLWLRETWAPMCRVADPFCVCDEEAAKINHYTEYKADTGNPLPGDWPEESRGDEECTKWLSPIFMPRWASRITLEIVSVRVERLQNISEADAFAEGISGGDWLGDPVGEFAKLWNSINLKRGYGWETNCWVWVLEFKRIDNAKAD
jgi:hypothetical protein